MKNKLGTNESLNEHHPNGSISYRCHITPHGFRYESTYDERGNELTYKDQDGGSYKCTYDENNNELTFIGSGGYSSERTYDENDNELTFKKNR